MIIQFSIENFRSIMEPATLSLVASPLKDARVAAEDVMFDIEGMDVSLLKSAVILGANASGKSNVIRPSISSRAILLIPLRICKLGRRLALKRLN